MQQLHSQTFSRHAEISRIARELNQVKCVDWRSILPTKLVATATSLDGSFMYSHSSTNPANWVKIGPVDVQTKGLTESLKNTSPPSQRSDDVEL